VEIKTPRPEAVGCRRSNPTAVDEKSPFTLWDPPLEFIQVVAKRCKYSFFEEGLIKPFLDFGKVYYESTIQALSGVGLDLM